MNSLEWVRLALLASLARGCYEAARPRVRATGHGDASPLLAQSRAEGGCGCKLTNPELGANLEIGPHSGLPPQAREWMRRELRRYGEAQERKWRRWTEAMFERRS